MADILVEAPCHDACRAPGRHEDRVDRRPPPGAPGMSGEDLLGVERAEHSVMHQRVQDRQHEHRPVLVQGEQDHNDEEGEVGLGDAARHVHPHRGRSEQPEEQASERVRCPNWNDRPPAPRPRRRSRPDPSARPRSPSMPSRPRWPPQSSTEAVSSRGGGAPTPRPGQLSASRQPAFDPVAKPLIGRSVDGSSVDRPGRVLDPARAPTSVISDCVPRKGQGGDKRPSATSM